MTPPTPPDPKAEFRAQRHDFILHYYEMAVKDLDRHLQMGWQSIATSAGAIATLSAGQQGYLPIPVAVLTAFIVSYWGLHNVIDANYWALRAIAFLANVEAVYFYKDDRKDFNYYAGEHPPYKLMNSLKVQFHAVAGIASVTIIFFLYHIALRTDNFNSFASKVATGSHFKVAMWLLPILLLVYLVNYVLYQLKKRVSEYLSFVKESPGPGMLDNRNDYRLLDPNDGSNSPPVTAGDALQLRVRTKLEKSEQRWKFWLPWVQGISVLIILALIILLIFKGRIFG